LDHPVQKPEPADVDRLKRGTQNDDAPDLVGTADRDGLKLGAPAAVVVPVLPSALERGASASERRAEFESFRSGDAKQDEALGLAGAIDLDVRHCDVINVRAPRPSHLFGKGQLATVREAVAEHDLEVVVVDYPLTPIQQRNLERDWQAKVLDRTGLILEIFGRRAQTKEGRLQVELAHLTFQKSRLVRSWTHLERQRGGTGFLGGPGETQMEADRRIIQTRIDGIKRDLERVQNMRTLHRKGRKRAPSPVVALVGYTNAGKSTLFNQLTGSDIFAKDLLFATLDPTMRELFITPARKIILSDTVGFISELPTSLIAAFRATLEEVLEADVILHVRDIAHADSGAQRADVLNVLAELGVARPGREQAPAIDGGPGTNPAPVSAERFIPTIEVWNKTDLLSDEEIEALEFQARGLPDRPVLISAHNGTGLEALRTRVDEALAINDWTLDLEIAASAGQLHAWVHSNGDVLEQASDPETGAMRLTVRLSPKNKGRLINWLTEHPADARIV